MNGNGYKVLQFVTGILLVYTVIITTYVVTTRNLAARNKEDIKEFKDELKNINKNVTNIAIKLGVVASN